MNTNAPIAKTRITSAQSDSNQTARVAALLAGDPTVEAAVQREITMSAMVTRLMSMRVAKDVTQEKVAAAMDCDASKISRLEAGNDASLKWNDILAYVRALDLEMTVSFADKDLPAAARIKHCVLEIDRGLQELAALAAISGADEKITQGIHRFYAEVLFNFLKRFKDGLDTLGVSIKYPPAEPATTAATEDNTQAFADTLASANAEHAAAGI